MIKIPKNKHKGGRAFIIASGPSTKGVDFSWLKNEITICVNQSYKLLNFDPTYVCISDQALWRDMRTVYPKKSSKIIACFDEPQKYIDDYPGDNLAVMYKNLGRFKQGIPEFSFDLEKGLWRSLNVVTLVAIPFAFWCGFDSVYLLGCDCNNKGYGHELEKPNTHQLFHDEVFKYYEKIAQFKGHTKVYNSTNGGNLEYFPRVSLDSIRTPLKIVGYYTPDPLYSGYNTRWKSSLGKLGVDCHSEPYNVKEQDKRLKWIMGVSYKPFFIWKMMEKFPRHNLFYLDIDAQVNAPLTLFEKFSNEYDFAAVFIYNRFFKITQLCGGGLFFANNPKARQLVRLWKKHQIIRMEEFQKGIWSKGTFYPTEQETLQSLVYSLAGLRYLHLPQSYGYIKPFNNKSHIMSPMDNPVITHFQASREAKK